VRIALLRTVCAAAGVTNIDVKGERAVFYTSGSRDVAFVETLRGSSAEAKLKELARAVRTHRRQ